MCVLRRNSQKKVLLFRVCGFSTVTFILTRFVRKKLSCTIYHRTFNLGISLGSVSLCRDTYTTTTVDDKWRRLRSRLAVLCVHHDDDGFFRCGCRVPVLASCLWHFTKNYAKQQCIGQIDQVLPTSWSGYTSGRCYCTNQCVIIVLIRSLALFSMIYVGTYVVRT